MSYYDVVKSTYSKDLNVRIDSELIVGGYKDKDKACDRARLLVWQSKPSELGENQYYEVEQHNSINGSLECVFSLN